MQCLIFPQNIVIYLQMNSKLLVIKANLEIYFAK